MVALTLEGAALQLEKCMWTYRNGPVCCMEYLGNIHEALFRFSDSSYVIKLKKVVIGGRSGVFEKAQMRKSFGELNLHSIVRCNMSQTTQQEHLLDESDKGNPPFSLPSVLWFRSALFFDFSRSISSNLLACVNKMYLTVWYNSISGSFA